MKLASLKTGPVIVIGLGGTGLSCARFLAAKNIDFRVVDSRENPPGLSEFIDTFPNVEIRLGQFDANTLTSASTLVVSPGVSLTTPAILEAVRQGVSITGDIDIFSQNTSKPIVAVTGSNGKSSVVAILAEILNEAQVNFGLGGNLDGENFKPALDLLLEPEKDLYVLELSSFQLETTKKLGSKIAVILNLSEDHMDRYESFEDYYLAKANIFNGCEQVLINLEDGYSGRCRSQGVPVWEFGYGAPGPQRIGLIDSTDGKVIGFDETELVPVSDLKVVGEHNVLNVLAAVGLSLAVEIDLDSITAGILKFTGLPHRCQWVAEVNGVGFYNDSKGTNVGATVAAVTGLGSSSEGKVILIAGGVSKGADFHDLISPVTAWCRQVVVIGQDAETIEEVLSNHVPTEKAQSLSHALDVARSYALAGDVVLFSPACASFDMFENFQARGFAFVDAVERLK